MEWSGDHSTTRERAKAKVVAGLLTVPAPRTEGLPNSGDLRSNGWDGRETIPQPVQKPLNPWGKPRGGKITAQNTTRSSAALAVSSERAWHTLYLTARAEPGGRRAFHAGREDVSQIQTAGILR